jgi:CheY-like chemotaxis protein
LADTDKARRPGDRGVGMLENHSRTRKVLIVDDEYVPRSLETVALEGTARYATTEAGNATDALTLLAGSEYDCVVVDLDMPDMSGDDLIGMIRANREQKRIPIVLVLPESSRDDESLLDHPGATRVITKPFDPWDLARLLDILTGALTDESHSLSVEAVLRGFPHPTMVLDEEHRVILANGEFYKNTGTGVGECYVYCMEQLHSGAEIPPTCPLQESARTGLPSERTVATVFGAMKVFVYPLATTTGDSRRLYLHVTQPAEELRP